MSVEIPPDSSDARFWYPGQQPLKITPPPGISVRQSPAPDNGCGPISLVNDSKDKPVPSIRFRWVVIEK
jgi:hypothetical protein